MHNLTEQNILHGKVSNENQVTQKSCVPQDPVETLGKHERHADDEDARPEKAPQQRRATIEGGVDPRHRHLPKGAPRPSLPPLHREEFLFAAEITQISSDTHIFLYISSCQSPFFVLEQHTIRVTAGVTKKCRRRRLSKQMP